jgi:hypothetical protein
MTALSQAQLHQVTCCLMVFCVLERERQDQQLGIDTLKRQLSFKGRAFALPSLKRLRRAASPLVPCAKLLVAMASNLVYDVALCESLRERPLERRNNHGA